MRMRTVWLFTRPKECAASLVVSRFAPLRDFTSKQLTQIEAIAESHYRRVYEREVREIYGTDQGR